MDHQHEGPPLVCDLALLSHSLMQNALLILLDWTTVEQYVLPCEPRATRISR